MECKIFFIFWFISNSDRYLCEDLRVAKDFCLAGVGWKKSKILGHKIGCVCMSEVALHPDVIISKDSTKKVDYFFQNIF